MVASSLSSTGSAIAPQEGGTDRVAVLLIGYGEVESYEDFANYNEQALNFLSAFS